MSRKKQTEKVALEVVGTCVILIIVLAVWIQFLK